MVTTASSVEGGVATTADEWLRPPAGAATLGEAQLAKRRTVESDRRREEVGVVMVVS